ncbi:AsnC family transcriptional regulator [Terasakiella sp. A23]|uniref:siroheme decarboxylase subunit beta n=1 Tax=Terasakiella sp. FCG-A23 TaxID=3080561 RepID=UPI0029540FCD|nr:AsnC family transcriptional regulator [Terasakiella sp. A23]MDV7341286.1 AsnC family transcriptional regulator [Terasakiella sp. A23]
MSWSMDETDRKIIKATQEGLPLVAAPYDAVGEEVGLTGEEVRTRMNAMLEAGAIRRIGAVPNHYALGYTANGMSTWDVPDEKVKEIGEKIGALDFVSHCYERPRHQGIWNYNLFAMVHGKDKETCHARVQIIADMLGEDDRGHEVLFSSRILKKTGLRIA